jgi:hypothetical protein
MSEKIYKIVAGGNSGAPALRVKDDQQDGKTIGYLKEVTVPDANPWRRFDDEKPIDDTIVKFIVEANGKIFKLVGTYANKMFREAGGWYPSEDITCWAEIDFPPFSHPPEPKDAFEKAYNDWKDDFTGDSDKENIKSLWDKACAWQKAREK